MPEITEATLTDVPQLAGLLAILFTHEVELAPDPVSQQALRFLISTGEAVEINMEVLMAAESVKRATELIRQFIREHGPATVSELRQALGSSRRVIVPLLERLDREGVTLRQNDKRALPRALPKDSRNQGNGVR